MTQIIEVIVSPRGQTRLETKGFTGASCQAASQFLERALSSKQSEQLTAEYHSEPVTQRSLQEGPAMTTLRRRVLRPPLVAPVNDVRLAARAQHQRTQLANSRLALKRWLTGLKRATGTVTTLHAQICRIESQLQQKAH